MKLTKALWGYSSSSAPHALAPGSPALLSVTAAAEKGGGKGAAGPASPFLCSSLGRGRGAFLAAGAARTRWCPRGAGGPGAGRPGSREPERCKRSVCPPEVLPAGNPQNRALEGVRARNCFAVSQQRRSGWPSWFNNQSFTERLSLSKLAELIGGAIRVQKSGHIDRLAKSGLSYRESK